MPQCEVYVRERNKEMFIKKTINTEEGEISFEGEVSEETLDIIIEAGLLTLFDAGLLPFATLDDPSQMSFDFSEDLQ